MTKKTTSDPYFISRQQMAAISIHAARAVEKAVSIDIKNLMEDNGPEASRLEFDCIEICGRTIRDSSVSREYYHRTRSSFMLEKLAEFLADVGEVEKLLTARGYTVTTIDGVNPTTGEFCVRLHSGNVIRSGWNDKHDPDALPAGDYLAVDDKDGRQLFYCDTADLVADGVEARKLLCQFMQACAGHVVAADPNQPHETGLTPPP